ncbi:MAG TPA: GntR family transcriptional regulator [Anaerolineae bacterium]|nr:GntR family transcriptional regulator [Anaerolineae bacterium]
MVHKSASLAQQVVDEILAGIQTGDLAREGGSLPSEAELSLRFNVSRATVREALSRLEQAGVVTRRHGVGTFVAPRPPVIETGLEELESLETMAQRIGLETHMNKAAIEERAATAEEADRLQITAGELVLSVARVMLTGKRPVAYLIDIVPTRYLRKSDLAAGFNGSVLDLFLQRGSPALSYSRTDICAAGADDEIALKLRLQGGDALLRLDAQLFTREGGVVDYSISYFVPGHFRFHVMRRVNQGNGEGQLKSR